MSARELREWMAFYAIDPFGDQRADLRMGVLAATMNNRWRGKSEQPAEPTAFMPFYRPPQQTPDQIQRILRSVINEVEGIKRGQKRIDRPDRR